MYMLDLHANQSLIIVTTLGQTLCVSFVVKF